MSDPHTPASWIPGPTPVVPRASGRPPAVPASPLRGRAPPAERSGLRGPLPAGGGPRFLGHAARGARRKKRQGQAARASKLGSALHLAHPRRSLARSPMNWLSRLPLARKMQLLAGVSLSAVAAVGAVAWVSAEGTARAAIVVASLCGAGAIVVLDWSIARAIEAKAREVAAAQQRAEQHAREAERVAAMVESAPSAILSVDAELVIRYMNPASRQALARLAALVGRPEQDLVGRPFEEFYAHATGNRAFFSDPKNLPFWTRHAVGNQ